MKWVIIMMAAVRMMRWSCHKKPSQGGGGRWHSDLGDNITSHRTVGKYAKYIYILDCQLIHQIHFYSQMSFFCEFLFQWVLWRLFLRPAPFDDLLNLACVLPVMLSKHLNISGTRRLKSFWRDDSQIVHLLDSQTILPSSWVRSLVTQSHASRLL